MAGIDSFENKVTYIVVSGVKMTKKEYQKYKKEKDAEMFSKLSKKKQREITKAKRDAKKKRETEITVLPDIIKDIVKFIFVYSVFVTKFTFSSFFSFIKFKSLILYLYER